MSENPDAAPERDPVCKALRAIGCYPTPEAMEANPVPTDRGDLLEGIRKGARCIPTEHLAALYVTVQNMVLATNPAIAEIYHLFDELTSEEQLKLVKYLEAKYLDKAEEWPDTLCPIDAHDRATAEVTA